MVCCWQFCLLGLGFSSFFFPPIIIFKMTHIRMIDFHLSTTLFFVFSCNKLLKDRNGIKEMSKHIFSFIFIGLYSAKTDFKVKLYEDNRRHCHFKYSFVRQKHRDMGWCGAFKLWPAAVAGIRKFDFPSQV